MKSSASCMKGKLHPTKDHLCGGLPRLVGGGGGVQYFYVVNDRGVLKLEGACSDGGSDYFF